MGKLESNVRKVKLRTKFAVLMVTLFAVALAVNVVWTTEAQRQQTENELQEKGLVLSQQMTAMWDFMSANQEKLEAAAYGSTGSYQGLHCAVVGRSIGRLFSIESGYTTRFVNFNPRNSEDEPDEFEAAGLDALYADPTLTYYASITQYDGSQVYRYMAPMEIKKSCLECHGEPAGELDVTGHAKEGWSVGDVGGAISIVIPMDIYIQAERNGIDFSCSIDADVPLIEADFEKIRHVVENLVGNAMKFTPEGGKVRVTVSYHPECEQAWICVSDTGIGVANADRERIFERFAQADSSVSRKYRGTGLGLALAKEYVEMHSGDITLESKLGHGSAFTVRLPIRQAVKEE